MPTAAFLPQPVNLCFWLGTTFSIFLAMNVGNAEFLSIYEAT
jgi:hypothetical protein